ncbi:MAG: Ig-like domain-containing protein [Actinomycetota bacterium]|nr:Ig-like domain-containing protein [Actinomycetota bacterium]
MEPGPPAIVTLAPPASDNPTNPVDTQHCVTATVTDLYGNPTPNISVVFSVTGSNTAGGSDRTDAEGEAEFCYTGVLIGIVDVIRAFADADEDGIEDAGEPSDTTTKVWEIPASTPLCGVTITEGGWILAQNGDRASFGGNVQVSSLGQPSGQQTYQDHGPVQQMTVKSTTILAVICSPNRKQATIFGLATIDGSGTFAFRIDVQDLGEPGVGRDTYRMRILAYDSGESGTLLGGNVQIHRTS